MANIQINKTKLILVEGRHAQGFIEWLCKECRDTNNVQVMNFGGNPELRLFIKNLSNMDGYDSVESFVIVRDAEGDVESAIDSINGAFESVYLPVPAEPFTFNTVNNIKTAYMIFPGPDASSGTLEDLCLSIIHSNPTLECIDGFFECVKEKNTPETSLTHLHKRKVQCYLSTLEPKFIGANIGEAAERGAWDIKHQALLPFKQIITGL